MADRIRESQSRNTMMKFIEPGVKSDVLLPQQHMSINAPIGAEFKYVGPNNTPTFADQLVLIK